MSFAAPPASIDVASVRRPGPVRRYAKFYLYLAPTFILLLIFNYYPPLSALYHAFFEWDGIAIQQFNGLDNFRQMASDDALLQSVPHVLALLAFGIFASIVPNLFVAELIFNLRSVVSKYWYRLILVIPIVVPGIVGLLLWKFFYDPDYGLFNAILGHFGFPPQGFLTDPSQALYCFMFLGFPFIGGINVLILLAGLNNMGESLMDSAKIDGAGGITRFWYIDLPLIIGQVKLLSVLAIIGGLQGYGGQLILTKGGPGYSTMVPGLRMYQAAFVENQKGYACAIGLLMFIVVLIFTYINQRYIRTNVEYDA